MKYLKLGLNLFVKHLVISLLLVFQLAASLLLINVTLGRLNAQTQLQTLFEPIAAEAGVYVMPPFESFTGNKNQEPKFLKDLKNVKHVSLIDQYSFSSKEFPGLNSTAYDDFLLSRLPFLLQKGKGFETRADGAIPLLISNETAELRYGQTVELPLLQEDGTPGKPIRFYISGVLDASAYYMEFNAHSKSITYNQIFYQYDSLEHDGEPMLFLRQSDMKPFYEQRLCSQNSSMVFFHENISKQDYQENLELLNQDCMVQPLEKMNELGNAESQEIVRSMMPMMICVFAISLIGMISFQVLHTLNQMKNFSIYYICGSRWKNCLLICCGFLFWVVLLTLLLLCGCYAWGTLTPMFQELGCLFAQNNVWGTLGAFLLCFVCAALPPFLILKNTQPVELFHSQN